MSETTLKFDNIRLNKKEFRQSKKPIDLMSVNVDWIVYLTNLSIVTKVIGILLVTKKVEFLNHYVLFYLKWVDTSIIFKKVVKNVFFVRDDNVLDKYNEIWDVIKKKLKIKFHSMPIYDEKYLKTKIREYDGVIRTSFLGNDVPKENMHYTCIACLQKKLSRSLFRGMQIQMWRFINTELDSDSEPDAELMAKLKSDSDNDFK